MDAWGGSFGTPSAWGESFGADGGEPPPPPPSTAGGGGDLAFGFGQVWDLRDERATVDELAAIQRDDEEVLTILATVLPRILK